MNDISIGYLAGIIDGEGCIYVRKTKPENCPRRKTPSFSVKICVSITSYPLIEWFKEHAQLTSIFYKESKSGSNRKAQWACTWNGKKAKWLLELVKPHLVIKKEQADLALQLIDSFALTRRFEGPQEETPDHIIEWRQSIKDKISELNKRAYRKDGSLADKVDNLDGTFNYS